MRDRPSPAAPRRRRGREDVLTAATALFVERGYDATSMRHIADRLGITKAALYRHVSGKQDVLSAVTRSARTELDGLLARSGRPGARAVERLAELLASLVRFTARGGGRALVWRTAGGAGDTGREEVLGRLANLLARAADEGDVRDDLPPALVARLLLGAVLDIDVNGAGTNGNGMCGNGMCGKDLSGEDLSGEDLSGEDLSGEDLNGKDLSGNGGAGRVSGAGAASTGAGGGEPTPVDRAVEVLLGGPALRRGAVPAGSDGL